MLLMLWCILQLLHTWGKAPLIHLSEYYAWTIAGPFIFFKLCLSCLCSFFVHEVVKVNEFSPELFLFKKLLIFSLGDAMWIAIHELQLRVRNLGGNVGCWYGSLYFSLTERKSLVLPLLQGKKAYKSFRWQKAWLSGISEKHACFTCVICLASKAQWVSVELLWFKKFWIFVLIAARIRI